MAAIQIHKFQNPVFFQNMETMLSNKKYCDTIFLVNESQFHASSHVVSVASPELESLLDEHFKNCGDREVRIGEIKYEESFVLILRYIYGLTLDFTQVKKEILCEVIVLAERFKLPALTLELKKFLSNLECFEIDTVVALLNTAKVFHLDELLGRLTIFAYKNADKLINHASVVKLRYDILCDFVKSDVFYADEIDILKGVLIWHNDNMENPINDIVTVEGEVNNSLELGKESDKSENNGKMESMKVSNNLCDSKDKVGGIVQTFSQNILKTLLSHVRMKRLNVLDTVNLSKTEPYVKYKNFLGFNYFASSNDNRILYVAPTYTETFVYDVSKQFTFPIINKTKHIFESADNYISHGLKWTCSTSFCRMDDHNANNFAKVYLKCVPLTLISEWECTVVCQVKMISLLPMLVIPGDNTHCTLTLSSQKLSAEVGTFYYPYAWRNAYKSETKIETNSFEVVFKSIHIRIKKED